MMDVRPFFSLSRLSMYSSHNRSLLNLTKFLCSLKKCEFLEHEIDFYSALLFSGFLKTTRSCQYSCSILSFVQTLCVTFGNHGPSAF